MKQKVVKASITLTKAVCTTYSETTGISERTVTLPATFKTEEGLEKALRDFLTETTSESLVKVNTYTKIKGVYTMPIDEFIEHSTYEEM